MTIEEIRQKLALDKLQETGIGLVSPRTYQAIGAALIPHAGIRLIQNPFIPDGEIWPFEKWDFGSKPKTQFELNSDRDSLCSAIYLQTEPKYVHLSEVGKYPMITAKDITVSVSCLFENTDPIWMLMASAAKFGYMVKPYGLGATYSGWVDIKVNRLRKEALDCPTSHIMYTDARDAWFLAGPTEVAVKYNLLGCPPILLSAQCDVFGTYAAWYKGIPWDMAKVFRYIGTPGQLCEAKALADALGWMQENYHLGEPDDPQGLPDDDPSWWLEYMRAHPGYVKLDTECDIFMNAGSQAPDPYDMWNDFLEFRETRVYNRVTKTYPCVLHFNGGYSHALHGKWERLEPFWRRCGHTENPPWLVDSGDGK